MANGKNREQLIISTAEAINRKELHDNGPEPTGLEFVAAEPEKVDADPVVQNQKPVKQVKARRNSKPAPDNGERINVIHGRPIFDSRGNRTVEADVTLQSGAFGRASAPSGASTGEGEAVELRDNDPKHYDGQDVRIAASNVDHDLFSAIKGKHASQQVKIDQAMIRADGTENKGRLGANAILAVSMAVAKAAADHRNQPLHRYLRENEQLSKLFAKNSQNGFYLPVPLANIINGGKHAKNQLNIQEVMIVPKGFNTFSDSVEAGQKVFKSLKKLLEGKGMSTTVGDEGGFAPSELETPDEAINLIKQAIELAGYKPGEQIAIALDMASSEFYKGGIYSPERTGKNSKLDSDGMVEYVARLTERHPEIISIEDAMAEHDWDGWKALTDALPRVQLVGDDLFVTNEKVLQKGIDEGVANSILIKLNQIGTMTETFKTISLAQQNGYGTILSHRSGETEDYTIADIAVAINAKQIKTGSFSRTDRMAKYNQLLRIEEDLGAEAQFAGNQAFARFDI